MTGSNYKVLTEVQIGNLTLKNRVALAPMTRTSATKEGLATDEMAKYFAKFARGGFGLVITDGTYSDETYSQGYFNQPGIANDSQVEAWRKVTDAVHREGGRIFVQLMHAGALSQGNVYKNETVAPSAVQPKGTQLDIYGGSGSFQMPREITKAEIQDLIHFFGQAAKRAVAAGFDGVEIHGANGYILDQFLTDYTNQRTDEYGGSVENRVRLLVEVAKVVRRQVGPDFVAGIRIAQSKVNDYHHKWAGQEEDAKVIFKSLADAGLDFIHVTEYDITKPAFGETGDTLAALAKKYGQKPIIANGNLEYPENAEKLLQNGEADLIALGKGALANPDWPERIAAGKKLIEFDPNILQPKANIKPQEL
jgi:2,4-dienoyl-CoA reductase-like NADH-dependent reductase (Old Yellow Enzyme family)